MNNYKLLLFGALTMCFLGNSQVGSWTQTNNFQGAERNYPISFSINGKGYIGAGQGDGGVYYSDIWEYEPSNDSWSQKANLPGGGRWAATSFSIGDKGYAGIGTINGNSPTNDFWEYNPTNNTWTQKANYPGAGKVASVGFAIEGKGYIGTGSPSSTIGNETNDFWEYNPLTDTWTQKSLFAGGPRDRAVGFSIGEKGYIGTGYFFNGSPNITNDFWEYDPTTNLWTQKASLPGSERNNAIGFSIGNNGFIGLGNQSLLDFWHYDSENNLWTQMANFSGPSRLGSIGLSIGNKGYVGFGYYIESGTLVNLNDFWEYENSVLSLDDNYFEREVSIYPNPAIDNLQIKLSDQLVLKNVVVYDLNGKELQVSSDKTINVASLSNGLYFIQIVTQKGIITKKFIKN